MNCIICSQPSTFLLETTVLFRHQVKYYRCTSCGQIQTEKPYWLDEAYGTAIASLDIGLLDRSIRDSNAVFRLALKHFDVSGRMLDYGGGYGVLVRLLRDKGLDFYRQDIYCQNIFALNQDLDDLPPGNQTFELVTCFEVFEHTYEPLKLLETLTKYGSNILISTLLVPGREISSPVDWWYIAPETGQHVTFYTMDSLQRLAEIFKLNLYSNGQSLHLFSKRKFDKNPLAVRNTLFEKIANKLRGYLPTSKHVLPSLVTRDLETARQKAFQKRN
jgi:hypothetical protein